MDVVYFVQAQVDPRLIRIGRSAQLESRLAALQRESPVNVKPIGLMRYATWEDSRKVVRSLRRKFRTARAHGDWFRPTEALLHFIDTKTERYTGPTLAPVRLLSTTTLRPDEVAKMLDTTVATLSMWVQRGYIPALQIGKTLRFLPEDVAALQADRQKQRHAIPAITAEDVCH